MEKEYLLQKWLNNELAPEEQEAFKALDEYQFYVDIVENAKEFKASDFSKVDDFDTFNIHLKENTQIRKKSIWTHPFLRIAAMLIIALGVYFTFFDNAVTHINTLAQQKTTIELPDNSKVTLNALSEVSFSEKNWNTKRELHLKGEAFFKVKKGKTFDVITSQGIVTVVGTQFSVKQRDNFFEVKCYEGIVKVSSDSINRTLTAGETYLLLDDEFSESTTSYQEPQWLNNISSFEKIPFKEVVSELERQYDIEIKLETIEYNPQFTGGFVHNSLKNALNSITEPLNLTYKIISPKQVVIYGHKK